MLKKALIASLPLLLFASSPLKSKLEIEHKSINRSDLKGSNGGFESRSNKVSIENRLFGFGYKRLDLDWHNVDKLPQELTSHTKEPISSIQTISTYAKYPKKLTETKWLITGALVSTTHEKELNDSYSLNIYSVITHTINNNYSASYGASANYHPIRTTLLPVFGLNYRQRATTGLTGTIGYPRTFIGYSFTERWRVSGGVVFSSVLAKLAKNSSIAPDGYMQINAYQSDLAVRYNQTKKLFFESSYRYAPIYQFTTYNSDGDKIKKYKLEATSGFAFRVGYRF